MVITKRSRIIRSSKKEPGDFLLQGIPVAFKKFMHCRQQSDLEVLEHFCEDYFGRTLEDLTAQTEICFCNESDVERYNTLRRGRPGLTSAAASYDQDRLLYLPVEGDPIDFSDGDACFDTENVSIEMRLFVRELTCAVQIGQIKALAREKSQSSREDFRILRIRNNDPYDIEAAETARLYGIYADHYKKTDRPDTRIILCAIQELQSDCPDTGEYQWFLKRLQRKYLELELSSSGC